MSRCPLTVGITYTAEMIAQAHFHRGAGGPVRGGWGRTPEVSDASAGCGVGISELGHWVGIGDPLTGVPSWSRITGGTGRRRRIPGGIQCERGGHRRCLDVLARHGRQVMKASELNEFREELQARDR